MSVCLLLIVKMKRRPSPICTNVQDIDKLWHSQSWSMLCTLEEEHQHCIYKFTQGRQTLTKSKSVYLLCGLKKRPFWIKKERGKEQRQKELDQLGTVVEWKDCDCNLITVTVNGNLGALTTLTTPGFTRRGPRCTSFCQVSLWGNFMFYCSCSYILQFSIY